MESDPVSLLIVEEVARKEGVPPEELSPPLNTAIDAEALDEIVQPDGASPAAPVEITFEYRNYTVRVRTDAGPSVSVHEAATSAEAAE